MFKFYQFVFQVLVIIPVIFAQSGTQYADILVEAHYEPWDEKYDRFYGGDSRSHGHKYIDPQAVLGDNPYYVSIPVNSYIIVQFTDNLIVDHAEGPDIFADEIDAAGDKAEIQVSSDGINFETLGIARGGITNSLDLADISFKGIVSHVKVIGLDTEGDSPGFDVIRIYGLPNSNIDKYVPLDSLGFYFDTPNVNERRVLLKPIEFEFNSHYLQSEGRIFLDRLARFMVRYPELELKIVGHTDSIGSEAFNQQLSLNRAKAVYDYLQMNVSEIKITYVGRGETEPLRSNQQEAGRAKNRRVELIKVN